VTAEEVIGVETAEVGLGNFQREYLGKFEAIFEMVGARALDGDGLLKKLRVQNIMILFF
jgi:hypothetical protein